MKIYNFLKNKDLGEIEDYIEMLDKKGDREGLRQALKAREAVQRRNKREQRIHTFRKEIGEDFVKSNYKKMVDLKKAKDSNKDADESFKEARRKIDERKELEYLNDKGVDYKNKIDYLEDKFERQPQSEESDLRKKVMEKAEEAFPKPSPDTGIKRAEPPEDPGSLMKYTTGTVDKGRGFDYPDEGDETGGNDDEEIRNFIKRSRKRVGN